MSDDVFSGSSEEDLIDRTRKKLERDLYKEGFREGALKGQEESFQVGFDLGYAEGYRLGEVLGFYKGSSSLLQELKMEMSDIQQKKELHDFNEGERACIMCQQNKLPVLNVENVLRKQKTINDKIISVFSC